VWFSDASEAKHIVAAYAFELGHVEVIEIRSRVVDQLNLIDHGLAARVAAELGLPVPDEEPVDDTVSASAALSQLNTANGGIETRKVAVLAADGIDVRGAERFIEAMRLHSANPEVLAPTAGGTLCGGSGGQLTVDRAITSTASVLYDAVVVPGGPQSVQTLGNDGNAVHFVAEAYKHLKTVGAFGAGIELLRKAGIGEPFADRGDVVSSHGVVTTTAAEDSIPGEFFESFASALAKHRAWDRKTDSVPA
jgi:catalase